MNTIPVNPLQAALQTEGWMSPEELTWLALNSIEKAVVEIGCYMGRSSQALALGSICLTCIDTWEGSAEHQPDLKNRGLARKEVDLERMMVGLGWSEGEKHRGERGVRLVTDWMRAGETLPLLRRFGVNMEKMLDERDIFIMVADSVKAKPAIIQYFQGEGWGDRFNRDSKQKDGGGSGRGMESSVGEMEQEYGIKESRGVGDKVAVAVRKQFPRITPGGVNSPQDFGVRTCGPYTNPTRCPDMVFIDAAHDYRSVLSDIHLSLLITSPREALICGHDYDPKRPGVWDAVNQMFPDLAPWTRIPEHIDMHLFPSIEDLRVPLGWRIEHNIWPAGVDGLEMMEQFYYALQPWPLNPVGSIWAVQVGDRSVR